MTIHLLCLMTPEIQGRSIALATQTQGNSRDKSGQLVQCYHRFCDPGLWSSYETQVRNKLGIFSHTNQWPRNSEDFIYKSASFRDHRARHVPGQWRPCIRYRTWVAFNSPDQKCPHVPYHQKGTCLKGIFHLPSIDFQGL